MKFKVSFLDFKDFLDKRFTDESQSQTPVTYYESDRFFYLFKIIEGATFWSVAPKDQIENIDNFRMEFLARTVVLLELPFESYE